MHSAERGSVISTIPSRRSHSLIGAASVACSATSHLHLGTSHDYLDYTEIETSVQALGYINQPLRVVTSSSHHGPTLNILEQWAVIFFLDLQPREIADNLPANILSQISTSDMQFGVGIREPLAEGFSLRDFSMRGSQFELSESQLKRQFFQRKKGSTPFVSPF